MKNLRQHKVTSTDMVIRHYRMQDFGQLHRLDQECFVPGISYSADMLKSFLCLSSAICLVAETGPHSEREQSMIVGFVLAEAHVPVGHIITLDVTGAQRRTGTGSRLLQEMEMRMANAGIESILLETAVNNESGIAFWEHHGYRTEAVLKRYYLGRIDALEMRKRLVVE